MLEARVFLVLTAVAAASCSAGGGHGTALQASPSPAASADPESPFAKKLPEIVARVDGQPILLAEILPLARADLARFPKPEREQHVAGALRRALDRYVERELLLQEALARGMTVPVREVDWRYDQLRREGKDDEAWRAQLARQGMSPQALKAELRAQHLVAELLEDETRRTPVAAADVRAAYDKDPGRFAAAGASPPPFEAVRAQVEARLQQERQGEIRAALLARLRARARVETYL